MGWLIFSLVLKAGAGSLVAECGCFCSNGQPLTLCTNVEEAQRNLDLCPPEAVCHTPPHQPQGNPPVPPHDKAHSCVRSSIWDPRAEVFREIKVCEVLPA